MKAVLFPFALAVFAGLAACGETRWIGEARRMPRWSDGEVSVLVRNVKGGVTLLFRADAEGRGGAWRFDERDFPGFGYMFDRGATTFWEQWVEHGSMHSHNHAMMSGSATFLLTRLAGIRPLRAGYEEVLVKPVFPRRLAWASGSIRTPHGRIAVGWKRENGSVTVEVDVPEGMKAWHETPSGVRRPLPPGRRTLSAVQPQFR